jgi:hypothetical protein
LAASIWSSLGLSLLPQGGLRAGACGGRPRPAAPPRGSLAPERNRLRERIDRESTPAFTQLASCGDRNRTSRRGVPLASYPTKDLDRLCSRATLDRGPWGTSRSLEEHGWTHHELHPGPVGGSTPGRPRALHQPDLEGRPSPTLGSAAPPAAACRRGSGRPGRASPIARASAIAARCEALSSSPAVPSPCHSQHDATGSPRSTTDTPGHLTWAASTTGARQHKW